MVILSSGFHFDHWNDYYPNKKAKRYFRDYDSQHAPFMTSEFAKRKAMSRKEFWDEHRKMVFLSNLSPRVYDAWVDDTRPAHYGFIVSELCDGTAKDVLLRRYFTSKEIKLLRRQIERLHSRGITHGDLKPSNIGVFLRRDKIIDCRFLDCQRVKHERANFAKRVKRDLKTFAKHVDKNIHE